MENLFDEIPEQLPEELVSILAENKHARIERIVSKGHRSPVGFWYDQNEHEWVVLLAGAATLSFDDGEPLEMKAGDCVLIPAYRKHRVDWTTADEPTIWLAVFYRD
ncbi:MAG: cupin domain-containing protein [Planctomycetaceae bacterium]|nr:cupin domain-containing protein [Planctomycetaceae bacterium]MCA9042930.1 cupin domain-containing protein [Planctomycetaceae bacterium]MCB9952299.1 cupin domain-containing protein [Planctomycetaceae bacterium]